MPFFLAVIAALAGATASVLPADQLFAKGDFAHAKAAYAEQVTKNPSDAAALLGLARVELYENDLEDAAKDARAVLKLEPANATAARLLETLEQRRAIIASANRLEIPASGVVLPFLESEPLPAVALTINGKKATFVIDTGAPELTLDPAFAQELGLKATGGRQGVFLGGRTAEIKEAMVERIEAGPIAIENAKATLLPSRGMHMFKDRDFDGVIGTTFLARFLATIDYLNHRLVLRPRTSAVPPLDRAIDVPMWLVGDHFIFAKGSVNALRDQLFSIDSGGGGIGFMPTSQTLAAAHIKAFPEKAHPGMGGGGEVTVIPTLADEVCLGSLCRKAVGGGYTPNGSPLSAFPFEVSGTVSHAFLEHYAVTFDFVRMRMLLAP